MAMNGHLYISGAVYLLGCAGGLLLLLGTASQLIRRGLILTACLTSAVLHVSRVVFELIRLHRVVCTQVVLLGFANVPTVVQLG
eukprot:m.285463 g.285463  ORF g.285463 m.285463 type:complete len:84 (-) comp19914_c0_seq32:166-417(-)